MASEKQPGPLAQPVRLPVWKKLVYATVAAALFFGLLELVLALAGVRPLLYEDDPYVGFSGRVPLFVKDGEQMVTAPNKIKWFNEQRFPRKKAAGATRIFCLGGSTTYGRPFRDKTSFCGWLREFLPAAAPSRSWEVVNAGGISYASYRIAALAEELVRYDPDLFIVYCGHNEFLERRTYGELMEMPEAVHGLQGSLAKSRTYSLLSRAIKKPPAATTEKTETLGTEVNTILDTSVGLDAYSRDEAWREKVIAHYRFNLARIVDIARSANAEVVFVMPASNLGDSTPFKSEHRADLTGEELARWKASFEEARQFAASGAHQDALAAIDQAVAIDPLHAETHYRRARILESLANYPEAREAFEEALVQDVCPLRMLPEMGSVLREIAAARDVPVVDFDAQVTAAAEHAIPGNDQFLDHVHPTIETHRNLAVALVDLLAEEQIASLSESWNEEVVDAITERVMASVDDYERGIALRNLANVLQWAGKYEDAYTAARKALALSPSDAYANFVAGDLAEKLGKTEEAMEQYEHLISFTVDDVEDAPYFVEAHLKLARLLLDQGDFRKSVGILRKALTLKPGHAGAREALPLALKTWATKLLQAGKGTEALEPLEQLRGLLPRDLDVMNWLGIALIQAQRPGEAISHLQAVVQATPRNPAAHNNLATAYAQTGDKKQAANHFQETVRLQPEHLGALNNLGELSFESGQLDTAQTFYQRVLQLQPGHPGAQARLAQIQERRAQSNP